MTATIMRGKALAEKIKNDIKQNIATLLSQGRRAPELAVILISDDPASQIYVKNKIKACHELGFTSRFYELKTATTNALLTLIEKLNHDNAVDGILVQLPLPQNIDTDQILDKIDPQKDVDGFHPYNIGRLCQKRPLFRSCTPFGIVTLFEAYQIETTGKHAVIVGESNIVGRPMMLELLNLKCTVTITHIHTVDLEKYIRDADIVVVAVGKAELIRGDWIKEDAVVVDVGINRLPSGQLVGDVEFAAAAKRAKYITPVPGGVGPMTVAMLMQNTLQAYKWHENIIEMK